jgi:hypothetical protein
VCEEDKQQVSQQEQWGAKLKQVLEQAKPSRSATKKEPNRQDIAAKLFTDKAVAWIGRRDPRAAVTQLLLAAGAWDDAPKWRQLAADGLVVHYGKEAPTLLLAVIADSVLDDVRSLGAVVADRVGRLTNDKAQSTIRPERRSWSLSRLLREAREHAEVA